MDEFYEYPSEVDEDYAYEDEPEMKAEMGAFERAGGSSVLGTKIDPGELKGKKMEDIAKKLSRISMSPGEKLRIYVDALSRKLNDEGILKISEEMIAEMLSFVINVKDASVINPIGYIYGYVATSGGQNMDKSRVIKTIKTIPRLNGEGGMSEPDVIRYSRLWMNL